MLIPPPVIHFDLCHITSGYSTLGLEGEEETKGIGVGTGAGKPLTVAEVDLHGAIPCGSNCRDQTIWNRHLWA